MLTTPLPPAGSLDELMALAGSRYSVHFEPVKIGDDHFDILQISDMDTYVDRLLAEMPTGMPVELPFWAKIWRTSYLLAYFAQRLPAEGRSLVEIGAGVGLCGLAAARRGFNVLITDIHPDALLFAQINILRNDLQERARVAYADFTQTRLNERFDVVLGSEVLYKEDHYRAMTKFLRRHLKQDATAEAVLGKEYNHKTTAFFKRAEKDFRIQSKSLGYRPAAGDAGGIPGGEKHLTTIYRLTRLRHE